MRETQVRSLGREIPLEKEMAPHSSTLAWKVPWMEEPGRLQSMGSQTVGHDWATSLSFHFHALEKEMATHSSVLAWKMPWTEEPGRLQSMGSQTVGHDWATSLQLVTLNWSQCSLTILRILEPLRTTLNLLCWLCINGTTKSGVQHLSLQHGLTEYFKPTVETYCSE